MGQENSTLAQQSINISAGGSRATPTHVSFHLTAFNSPFTTKPPVMMILIGKRSDCLVMRFGFAQAST
jgi:hypothetical protein